MEPAETTSLGVREIAQEAALLQGTGMYLGSGGWSSSSRIWLSFWLSLQTFFHLF